MSTERKNNQTEVEHGTVGTVGAGTGTPELSHHKTPAMRQYAKFKSEHPDCLLLFRMGDFYELFDQDAHTAHDALGITLTERTSGVPMAGVPFHSVEAYLKRLVDQGYRVAICDQVQDPKEAKGIVDRAVTQVITPGTLIDQTLLDDATASCVCTVVFDESEAGTRGVVAVAEISTGRFHLHPVNSSDAADMLLRLGTSELLVAEDINGGIDPVLESISGEAGCPMTTRPEFTFRLDHARDVLLRHYGVSNLEGYGIEDQHDAIRAAGGLLHYLLQTQAPRQSADGQGRLAHLEPPRRIDRSSRMQLDASTLRSLEIERTMRSGSTEGSLLSIMHKPGTPMGRRLLRTWLCEPLSDIERIRSRHEIVGSMLQDEGLLEELLELTSSIQDVARVAGRIGLGRATPRDLVAIGHSVRAAAQLAARSMDCRGMEGISRKLLEACERMDALSQSITSSCVEQPPSHMRDGGLFRDGIDEQLDEARLLKRDATSWLTAYQADLTEQTGIGSLKVGYNKVFGYYIEVSNANADKVPVEFTRKQTLKNAERYITPELKEFEEKVLSADSRALQRERELFDLLCSRCHDHLEHLMVMADTVAEIDVLTSFAMTAIGGGYCRPQMHETRILEIQQGRHPVLDRLLSDSFIPNDCSLASTDAVRVHAADPHKMELASNDPSATLALITGPNMAGKSTYIRQVALIVLMAHAGSFVPAASARIGLTDRIFTRIGSADELHSGQSTFMVEMTETANILHNATSRSLVILDEIGRGTSTLDGLSLAWAIAETLAGIECRTLFATHYHELTTLADRMESITNLHVAVSEFEDRVVFLHRILPGRTDRSYGIHVAELAGLPARSIERARQLLETLTVQTEGTTRTVVASDAPQMELFTEYLRHPVIEQLVSLQLDQMSPMDAFDALRRLRSQVDDHSAGSS